MRLPRLYIWLAAGLAVGGLGYYFFRLGLEKADKAASAAGLFIGIAGLGISVFNAVAASRSDRGATTKQSVTSSRVASGVFQASKVSGSIRITSEPDSEGMFEGYTPPRDSNINPPSLGGQSVHKSDVRGPVIQFDEVGGDIEVDR
ncbi:hypothetical protein [Micromonospora sp. NBS 11-29]|uniref:hypothetical protein n=1 Tax=Micromonospora sp. NBS 11-29 TaxID=1960879 RepID=UPI001592E38B|nr:hypothetical protein [Micromonospora sp. NBS 11-29]